MALEIREIENKQIWENFLQQEKEKTFLQSWNWGEFQKIMGNKIWRFGISGKEKELVAVSLVVKVEAKRGNFLFLPHGPIIKSQISNLKSQIFEIFLKKLKEIAKKEGCDFIRIAPVWKRVKENIEIFKNLGFKEAPLHVHPELTWELDITLPEEKLLMQMRKTTRYLIRQGLKNPDLKIESSQRMEDVEIFNQLYQQTVERHGFTPFSLDFLKNEVLAFLPDNQVSILLGKYKNEIVCGGIFIFWQKIAFYHHGASSLKYPKLPASYLLMWEAIKEAKKRKCEKFNFWGIAPKEKKNHPWKGLSLFKKGFGGSEKEYVKTQDFPLTSKYWLCYLVEKLRKIKRGL
jgi:lipid II:glycine glycyltransferase (peptidoglycan interpeptide bridge formation enzyme)